MCLLEWWRPEEGASRLGRSLTVTSGLVPKPLRPTALFRPAYLRQAAVVACSQQTKHADVWGENHVWFCCPACSWLIWRPRVPSESCQQCYYSAKGWVNGSSCGHKCRSATLPQEIAGMFLTVSSLWPGHFNWRRERRVHRGLQGRMENHRWHQVEAWKARREQVSCQVYAIEGGVPFFATSAQHARWFKARLDLLDPRKKKTWSKNQQTTALILIGGNAFVFQYFVSTWECDSHVDYIHNHCHLLQQGQQLKSNVQFVHGERKPKKR